MAIKKIEFLVSGSQDLKRICNIERAADVN